MTFLEIINAVMRRLREDEVASSNASSYSKLIGDFVNHAIYDCEHAWDWNVLKETITVTTAASVSDYQFHNADVKILEAINDDKDWYMRVITDDYRMKHDYLINLADGSPFFYSFQGKTGDYSKIKLIPTPTGVESIQFLTVKYTPEYALDGTDDSTEITIPSLPVVLNAYAQAVSERGEDGGISINEADIRYRQVLADSIAMDATLNHPSKVDWHVI